MIEVEESPVLILVLPNDDKRVASLRTKLEEYKGRHSPNHHKIMVLEKLLEEGTLDTKAFAEMLEETAGWFEAEAFIEACDIINNYCTGHEERNLGGTGLQKAPEA